MALVISCASPSFSQIVRRSQTEMADRVRASSCCCTAPSFRQPPRCTDAARAASRRCCSSPHLYVPTPATRQLSTVAKQDAAEEDANYNFDFKNDYSKKECLIPLKELLKSSTFLVDDICVFGVEILKVDVSSPEEKAVVVQKKTTTVQNMFLQNKGFIEGTYTWTINNFSELYSKHFVRSPTFEVGGLKCARPPTTYTDKIKSAAAGTTEYGKQLASTVYEKVASVGTAVAGKAQQVMPSSAGTATPGVGAQDGSTARTVTPGAGGPGNGQDKGVSGVSGVTAYIADYLRPGDEERSLSEAITGAVQQRKEGVGSTVSKAREVPAQAVTRAREAVTSLTGGNRVSETVQPTTEGNIGEGVAAEVPTLHGEEIGAPRTNTNGL
ncbi:hypothetical protein ACQ4PT_021776 [Festuca glaucescens]